MKVITEQELKEKVIISKSFGQLMENFGYSHSYNTRKRLVKLVQKYNIDISHFDPHYHNKEDAWPIGEKECLYCKEKFLTQLGPKRERKYCSTSCANTPNIGKRRSEETNRRVSEKLTMPPLKKICGHCNKEFCATKNKQVVKYCSRSCASKSMWDYQGYRENHSKNTIERIKNGNFGWRARKELSFPERVYKRFLEENGFKDRFSNNYAVCKDIKNKDAGYYYLDFYFPEFNLDLEIDGQQHKILERQEHDTERDASLLGKKYKIFRLEWREITTQKGKEFLKTQQQKLLEFLNAPVM